MNPCYPGWLRIVGVITIRMVASFMAMANKMPVSCDEAMLPKMVDRLSQPQWVI